MLSRALLLTVSVFLLGYGGFDVYRSGVMGNSGTVKCWGPEDKPAKSSVNRVTLEDCVVEFGALRYLRVDDEVVGLLLPLKKEVEGSFPTVLLQVEDPRVVALVVDDEVTISAEALPDLSTPTFEGALLSEDAVSPGRRLRLMEHYDDLDADFRVLLLGKQPDWTDGPVMLMFGLLGIVGLRRLRGE